MKLADFKPIDKRTFWPPDGLGNELLKLDYEVRKRICEAINQRVKRSFMAGAITMICVQSFLWGIWCMLK